jgi:lysyl endopeptidase
MKNRWCLRKLPSRMVFLLALLLVPAAQAFAKATEPPRSFSLSEDAKAEAQVQQKTLAKVQTELLLAQDRERGKSVQRPEPRRFAVAADVAYTLKNSGTWQTLADGRLWRLRIQSPGAASHNLGITRFDMPEGAKLWIYDPRHAHVEGPYMARHRSHLGSLWTPIIEGDEIVVEVFVPAGVAQPVLEIGKANQGYRGFDKAIPGAGTAGACENDVICPVGAPWADQIRAVGAYTVSGVATCTGTLLNNTAQDGTPYFLSANHCSVNSVNDATVVVYWNYQSPTCGTHGPGSTLDNQTGSIFRATYAPSDFLLLELSSVPPAAYNVFYSGWDASGVAPPMTVAIHHPSLDVKSISFSNSSPMSTAYGSNTPSVTGNHWRAPWDSGVTEPGSSGSCLFSDTTKRCIGQLHGGPSVCGGASLWDYYGKLSVSWNGGGTAATRLKDWLDPLNLGVTGMDGDPHVTTVDGIHYDFQGAGEYVALRDLDGVEIQTRSVPVSTSFTPGADPYDGLATCVSLNTAVAAKVDGHRITLQPNLSGVPDPNSLQVRIDGVLTSLGSSALSVGGGRLVKSPVGDGYEIDFPNGTALFVTPLYWASQGKWYMNVDVFRNPGSDGLDSRVPGGLGTPDVGGLMAPLSPGSWLPPLPDGSSLGSMPATLHQRYVDLYQKFGAAWRVVGGSLFDYAPGTSTATFTRTSWPNEKPPCIIPETPVAKPLDRATAERLCAGVADRKLNANCVFDVTVTGEPGFANLFLATQKIRAGATLTILEDPKDPTVAKDPATFVATVTARAASKDAPAGTVQFLLNGVKSGTPVALDGNGQATWKSPSLEDGEYKVTAAYTPKEGSIFLPSSSFAEAHTVTKK